MTGNADSPIAVRHAVDMPLPYRPDSAWRWDDLGPTISSANNLPTQLSRLLEVLSLGQPMPPPIPSTRIPANTDALARAQESFDRHGSDEARHGYRLLYAYVISQLAPKSDASILEIGLGTNNHDVTPPWE